MLDFISMLGIGLAAGILGAILGIGGGIIMLPATQFILGFNPVNAVGTTLLAVVFTSVSGAVGHYRQGNVKVREALLIGTGGLGGVSLGSYVFKQHLSNDFASLQLLMGLLFISMTIKMLSESYQDWKNYNNGKSPEIKGKTAPFYALILLGLFTGMLTGMMGIGGGFIMVPAMIWLFGAAPYEAVGTTLLAMLPIAATGALIKLNQQFVDINAGIIIGLGTILGAQIGVYVSRCIPQLAFKILFTLIFAYLSFNYLSNSLVTFL